MRNLNDEKRVAYVSLRIPITLKESLEREAKRHLTNLNALITRVITRYIRFDRMAEHTGSVMLSSYLFSRFIESLSEEELAHLGEDLGPVIVKPTFAFFNIRPDLNSLITRYFEPMGLFSGWFDFSCVADDTEQKLILEHKFGRRRSIFLQNYFAVMIKSVLGIEPRIESEERIVVIRFR